MNELKIVSRKGDGERYGQIDRERKKERERDWDLGCNPSGVRHPSREEHPLTPNPLNSGDSKWDEPLLPKTRLPNSQFQGVYPVCFSISRERKKEREEREREREREREGEMDT